MQLAHSIKRRGMPAAAAAAFAARGAPLVLPRLCCPAVLRHAICCACCLQEPDDLDADEAQRLLSAVSGKLSVLQQMLPRLLHAGHRILIFSQSTEVGTAQHSAEGDVVGCTCGCVTGAYARVC